MKKTGIERRVDAMGRIVVPQIIKTNLNWEQKELVEIFLENGAIALRKATGGATGITRRVDELGRIVIPKELRDSLGIINRVSNVEFLIESNKVFLKRVVEECFICGSKATLKNIKGKNICKKCIEELKK